MHPILFHIGPITLHTYGLLVAVGFVLAYQVARGEFHRRGLTVSQLEMAVWHVMIGALLGARATYMVLNGRAELLADPLAFFRIWEGGLVFYGGAIGGVAGLVLACRRWPGSFLKMSDGFSAPLLLGHAVGRLGCFAAGCCYGAPTSRPWGVVFTNPDSLAPLYERVHPTQLYESAGDLFLFGLALLVSRRSKNVGVVTAFYCMAYGAFRFAIEMLRGDDRGAFVAYLSPSQWGSLLLGGAGVGILCWLLVKRRHHRQ